MKNKLKMTLIQKIEALNTFCGGSLGFQSYTHGWEISSFGKKTLFSTYGDFYKENDGHLKNRDLEELVNEAYEIMLKETEVREEMENKLNCSNCGKPIGGIGILCPSLDPKERNMCLLCSKKLLRENGEKK